tara:strand:- start:10059 stop:10616 length:558 start_codon:yes stop_codon:yes gene_type:complete
LYKLFFGIDLGAKTGISVLDKNTMHTHESYFGTSKDEAMRYKKFWNHIDAMFEEACTQFDRSEIIVYYEYVARHLGTKAAHAYGAYRMILLMACHTWKIESSYLSVQAIKKTATNKGNAKKDLMIESANNRFCPNWDLTDNEADSMWIAYLGKLVTNESNETIEISGPIKAVKRDGSFYDALNFK